MIPLDSYSFVYHQIILAFVLFTAFYCMTIKEERLGSPFFQFFGLSLFLVVVLYMGLRPISGVYFGDMAGYAGMFSEVQREGILQMSTKGEWCFLQYVVFCSRFLGVHGWFLLTAFLYLGLASLAFRIAHREKAFVALLMFVASFSFWAYGTNGIRNGLAMSLVLLGIACLKRKWIMGLLFFMAVGIHKGALIPVAAFLLTLFYNKPVPYFVGYGLAVIFSLTMGSWWERFSIDLFIFDDVRVADYFLEGPSVDVFSRIGFRWDFLLYSLWPVVLGAYYVFVRKYRDPFYLQLLNTYIAANTFWVLVIQANYSNRFAYLSWFMMSWVIIYPLLKERFFLRQNAVIARTLLFYFAFTYLMFLLKGSVV